jgi:hypothetical protein
VEGGAGGIHAAHLRGEEATDARFRRSRGRIRSRGVAV